MKKITKEEYRKVLIEILKYFDGFCRKNKIKYSLIGGSLIGAVRENGIIEWDDDIDVVLTPEEYNKFIVALKKNANTRYKALIPLESEGYYLPYIKLIDTKTKLIEEGVIQKKDSGVFIDIFRYNYVPKNKTKSIYRKIILYRKLLAGAIDVKRKNNSVKNILKNIRRIIIKKLLGYKKIVKKYNNLFKYKSGNFVILNWPAYGVSKEIQKTNNIIAYIDHEFEDMQAMIFENYDEILTTTFGDYMTPPPIEKRGTTHNMEAYWKK